MLNCGGRVNCGGGGGGGGRRRKGETSGSGSGPTSTSCSSRSSLTSEDQQPVQQQPQSKKKEKKLHVAKQNGVGTFLSSFSPRNLFKGFRSRQEGYTMPKAERTTLLTPELKELSNLRISLLTPLKFFPAFHGVLICNFILKKDYRT
ncbi:hypothetical protein AAG570_005669 [Ranatra chinensis]|uniref:Uncharacterized protein n=1 Tax=Ranatra chinensis TaxID=642074 RepID=A0ABD0YJV4_9HEMI